MTATKDTYGIRPMALKNKVITYIDFRDLNPLKGITS